MVSPLEWIGDAFQAVADAIGSGFDAVRGWISTAVDNLKSPLDLIKSGLDLIKDVLDTIINWINPLSDDFFLKKAFIPSESFMTDYKDRFNNLLTTKLAFLYQVRDTLNAFVNAVESNVNPNYDYSIKADLSRYGIGQVEIVNGQALKAYGDKLKFWIGGLMVFLTAAFLWRRGSNLLGSGK